MAAMHTPSNDNLPPRAPPAPIMGRPIMGVQIVGNVGEGGAVTLTDPDWLAAPRPRLEPLFPNDPREA
jgi:hypothetical protein